MSEGRSVAYLTLQVTREGQAAHAHVHEVIDGLRDRKWDVQLFTPDYGSDLNPSAFKRVVVMFRLQFRLAMVLRQFSVLYVRSHFLALPSVLAAHLFRIPVIQECNGSYDDGVAAWPSLKWIAPAVRASHRWQYRRSSTNIAVTEGLAAWLNDEVGRNDSVPLSNGANVVRFRPGLPRHPGLPDDYALFFGALAPWQGIPAMLAATQDARWPQGLSLIVVGDGVMRDAVESFCHSSTRVRWLGSVPYQDMPAIVANARVSIAVKDHSAIGGKGLSPLKVYESMAAAVPVIVAEYPGVAEEVAAHGTGLVVRESDAGGISAAVAQVIANPSRSAQMGERGRSLVVALHSWDQVAEKTSQILRGAIAGSRTHSLV